MYITSPFGAVKTTVTLGKPRPFGVKTRPLIVADAAVVSPGVATVVVIVELDELFVVSGSGVALVTLVVFVITVPTGLPGATFETTVMLADCPAPSVPTEPITVPPVAPTAGVEVIVAPPLVGVAETNVVLGDKVFVMTTSVAGSPPLFVTVITQVMTLLLLEQTVVDDKFANCNDGTTPQEMSECAWATIIFVATIPGIITAIRRALTVILSVDPVGVLVCSLRKRSTVAPPTVTLICELASASRNTFPLASLRTVTRPLITRDGSATNRSATSTLLRRRSSITEVPVQVVAPVSVHSHLLLAVIVSALTLSAEELGNPVIVVVAAILRFKLLTTACDWLELLVARGSPAVTPAEPPDVLVATAPVSQIKN